MGSSDTAARLLVCFVVRVNASFKFWTALVLEGQQTRSRGSLVHADAPIRPKAAFECGKVPASATAIGGITIALPVRFKIRLQLDR